MVDTTVEVGGLKLRTPFLIGSGAHHGHGEKIKDYVKHMKDNHWAGLVTKSYGRTKFKKFASATREKPYLWTTDSLRRIAMQNRGRPASELPIQTGVRNKLKLWSPETSLG